MFQCPAEGLPETAQKLVEILAVATLAAETAVLV